MALLPLIGAGLGGFEAYRRSGGDLGATALGAGLGAVTPAGLRMAGTALGAQLAGMGLKTQAAQLVGMGAQAARKGGIEPVARLLSKGAGKVMGLNPAQAGALAAGGGLLLGAPAIAGGLASGVAGVAQRGAQTGAGVIGYTGAGEPVYGGQALPPGMGSYGPTPPTGDPLSVLGPEGMGRRLEQLKSAEAQRDAMRMLLPEIYKASEARSKSEFERQMAAAGIRQNIATRAAMLQAAQQAGLGMGAQAASQAGGALTSQYQYQ